jgi:hypothetical protein
MDRADGVFPEGPPPLTQPSYFPHRSPRTRWEPAVARSASPRRSNLLKKTITSFVIGGAPVGLLSELRSGKPLGPGGRR